MLVRIAPNNKNPVIRNSVLLRINGSSTSLCSARRSMKVSHRRFIVSFMWLLLICKSIPMPNFLKIFLIN